MEKVPGSTTYRFAALARRHGCYVVVGMPEVDDDDVGQPGVAGQVLRPGPLPGEIGVVEHQQAAVAGQVRGAADVGQASFCCRRAAPATAAAPATLLPALAATRASILNRGGFYRP